MLNCRKEQTHAHTDASAADAEGKPLLPLGAATLVDVEATSGGAAGVVGSPVPGSGVVGMDTMGKPSYAWSSSAFYRCLMLDEEALLTSREALRSAVEFGTIIAWFFVADRTSLIAPGTKVGRRGGGAGRCRARTSRGCWDGRRGGEGRAGHAGVLHRIALPACLPAWVLESMLSCA